MSGLPRTQVGVGRTVGRTVGCTVVVVGAAAAAARGNVPHRQALKRRVRRCRFLSPAVRSSGLKNIFRFNGNCIIWKPSSRWGPAFPWHLCIPTASLQTGRPDSNTTVASTLRYISTKRGMRHTHTHTHHHHHHHSSTRKNQPIGAMGSFIHFFSLGGSTTTTFTPHEKISTFFTLTAFNLSLPRARFNFTRFDH